MRLFFFALYVSVPAHGGDGKMFEHPAQLNLLVQETSARCAGSRQPTSADPARFRVLSILYFRVV